MTLAIFFVVGLAVGSFLNVLVYRLNIAETLVLDRSKCPHCKKMIRWYDNIPVLSFILLGMRCRDCKKKISWQYPIVEIATGVLFLLIGAKFFSPADATAWTLTIYYLGAVSALLAILVYDFLYMEIPGLVLWPALAWTIAFNLYFDWEKTNLGNDVFSIATYSGTLAAFAAFMFFFILVSVSKEKWMGIGDAYLAILLGFITGWPQILLAMFLAFFIGSIYGIILIISKKKTMKSQIPFAPFLVLGTLITIFCYYPITNWYFSLFYFYK